MAEKQVVLVVEDNQDVGRLFVEILQVAGHKPELIESGEQALDRLQTVTPALLLLDLKLPDMSGLEVIDRMRQDDRLKNTKVAVITADLSQVNEAHQHADVVLVKPVDYTQIRETLAELLNAP